jgi:thioester reductase-like protein
MPRHVFVTGASGYLGSRLVMALVTAVENPVSGTRIVEEPQIRRAQLP